MQGQGRSRAGMRGRGGMIGGGGGGYQYHRQQQQPGVMYPLGWEFQHLAYAQQAQQHVQALVQPMYGRAAAAGPSQRGFLPLGVQGAGILKPPAGLPQGPLLYGRGHARGQQRGRGWGGRGRDKDRKPLTKEALDADLDAWRMKDKKFGGDSLDADLDKYWKKKEEEPDKQDGEEILETVPPVEANDTSKLDASDSVQLVTKKPSGARTIDRNSSVDKECPSATRKEGPTKGVDVKL
ncbi:unnamed protein product [Sphagnum jensenii]|uniref:Chromatin target of PRMT1 protein C-terminal domain-containing protein n=1 Tax=Sphagnum jensenii TaxID=128206 RepID=A0ABP1BK83_9BRYO